MAGISDEQQWLLLSCTPGAPSLPSGSQLIILPNTIVHMPCAVRYTYVMPSQKSYVDSREASPKLRGGVLQHLKANSQEPEGCQRCDFDEGDLWGRESMDLLF